MPCVETHAGTLKDCLGTWMSVYKIPTVRPSTAMMYQAICKHICRFPCANMKAEEVREIHLQEMLNQTAHSGYSKSFCLKLKITLQQVFKMLRKSGDVLTNPADELTLPPAPKKDVLPLTHSQQDAVEKACAKDTLGHLLIFLLETGLRKGEMIALRWEDYDREKGAIFISKSKTPAGERTVYLTKRAKKIVDAQPRQCETIFTNTRGGPVTDIVLRRLVDRIRQASGVHELACHVCRHTFITRMCEHGCSPKAIAQIVGHSKAGFALDAYAKMEADSLRKEILLLDEDEKPEVSLPEIQDTETSIRLPSSLFATLKKEADQQNVTVDALATYLLTVSCADK